MKALRAVRVLGVGFALAAALILGLGWAVYDAHRKVNIAIDDAGRIHELLETIDDAKIWFLKIETSQRGYQLSGEEAYLTDRAEAIGELDAAIGKLQQLTEGNADQATRVAQLRALASQRVEIAQANEVRRRSVGFDRVWRAQDQLPARHVSGAFDALTEEMHGLIHEKLRLGRAQEQLRVTASDRLIGLSILVTMLVLWPAYGLALRQARRSESVECLLSEMVKGTPLVIWRMATGVDGRRRFEFVSSSVHERCGVRAEDVLRDPARALDSVVPEDRAAVEQAVAQAEQQLTPLDIQYRTALPDGSVRWIHGRANLSRGKDGTILWNGFWDDITDQKRLQLALDESYRELEAFSYSVSHDLRAPLSTINGFSKIVARGLDPGDAKAQNYLSRIAAAAQQMSGVIDGLLALARTKRSSLHAEALDLSDMAQSVGAELKEADPQAQVDVRCQDGLSARGDPRMVRQLLVNLMGNAWKFSAGRPDRRIEFGQCAAGGAFFVRDNGIGFDMADAGKLFNAFQRLTPGTRYEGTGIGLATVKRIVERHEGRVWVEAAPDQGATVFFTLGPPAG